MSEMKEGTAKWWNGEVEDRCKALRKGWLEEADKIVAQYEAEERNSVNPTFNILYSNTETLLPALYNSTPRPDVARRYTAATHERQLDSAVAQCAERLLEYSEDSNSSEYATFDYEIREAVLHALVPGQGQTRVRVLQESGHEQLVYDTLAYDRFIWQYARKWCQVSWVGFGYDLNREGFEDQFPEFCKGTEYKKWAVGGWKALKAKFSEDPESKPRDDKTGMHREPSLLVWEIWDHPTQKLRWICETFPDDFLMTERYPFKLSTRFPCPPPLVFVKRNNNLDPKPLYVLYEAQDRELQEISKRFLRVVKAIRARGAYNAKLTELEKIFGEDSDNAMIAVENADFLLQDNRGFDNAIWMVPIDTLVEVATKLAEAREQIKQTIYEITGIGDLLRGQAEAAQTAQQASTQNAWGTLRLKRMQNDVSIFCRELFRIAFEFMVNTYSQRTIQDITKLEYLTQDQLVQYRTAMGQYQQMLQAQQMQQQQAVQIAQQSGQPPAPPQPPPPPPVPPDQQRLMAFPVWEEIIQNMRDRFERTYRIDIETNSTVDLEATEDKASMAEFMNAFGQMAAGLQNMGETGMIPYDVSKEIMGELFRRYRFGRRVEQMLEMAQPPQQNGQAQAKQQMDALKQQHAAEQAGKEAQIQQVRQQLERDRAQFAKEKIEMVNALKIKEVELATAKGESAIDGKIAEHDSKLKDVNHATEKQGLQTQVSGAQRQTEMERLNHSQTKLSGQQELFNRDQQVADLAHQGKVRDFEHEQELGGLETDARERDINHQVETGNLKLEHATKEHERAAKESQTKKKEEDSAVKELAKHMETLAKAMEKLTTKD